MQAKEPGSASSSLGWIITLKSKSLQRGFNLSLDKALLLAKDPRCPHNTSAAAITTGSGSLLAARFRAHCSFTWGDATVDNLAKFVVDGGSDSVGMVIDALIEEFSLRDEIAQQSAAIADTINNKFGKIIDSRISPSETTMGPEPCSQERSTASGNSSCRCIVWTSGIFGK